MTSLRFACTGCGRCCDTAPAMTIAEALRLGDLFVGRIRVMIDAMPKPAFLQRLLQEPEAIEDMMDEVMIARGPARAVKEMTEHHRLYSVHLEDNRGHRVYATVTVQPCSVEVGRCPARNGDACGIYDRRPVVCAAVPVHPQFPDAMAGLDARRFTDNPEFACDSSDSAPLLVENGKLVNPVFQEARRVALDARLAERPLVAAICQGMGSTTGYLPSRSDFLAKAREEPEFSLPMTGVVKLLIDRGEINPAAARAYLEGQCVLMRNYLERMEDAMARADDMPMDELKAMLFGGGVGVGGAPEQFMFLMTASEEYMEALSDPGFFEPGGATLREMHGTRYRLRDAMGGLGFDDDSLDEEDEGLSELEVKFGRNDPCPCTSGRKYKRCCGAAA